ncbi:hypothetical protein [Streptomyces sp. NPDC048057]|uniref:hypothetical protein n=1 Tax=Streptomyces sp. NPDC048057 TaxID=3155628 RepID=UPI0033DA2043
MDLDTLRQGNFTLLNQAVAAWSGVVDRLKEIETDARDDMKAKADKADWAGVNATVSRAFIAKTAGEFTDAVSQATTIRDILRDTHDELVSYRGQLGRAIDRGTGKNITVRPTAGGGFTVTMLVHPDRAAAGTKVPEHSQQDVDDLRDEVQRILDGATESDSSAAQTLRMIADHAEFGFSDVTYQDRDSAAKAIREAEDAAKLIKEKGDEMSPAELTRLNSTLAANAANPLFQERFATSLGPKGVLAFWSDVADPATTKDLVRTSPEQLGTLQRQLGLTLAGATRSDSPAMRQWEDDMVHLSDERYQNRGSTVYGYQVMSNLMRSGDWDARFLNEYGNALVGREKEMKLPDRHWNGGVGGPPMPKMNFLDDRELGRDPMTGFMTALTRNPDAATDFFTTTEPQDNAAWVLKDRSTFDDSPLHDGPNEALDATGRAMFAAVSGISDPGAEGARFVEHTPEHREAMKRSLEHLAAAGNDFPPELRDDMARAMGNHGEAVHRSMSHPMNKGELDAGQLMEVSKQISRNQQSYGLLNEQMNYAIRHDIHTEKDHPEDSLNRAGRTIGFLEEARYQATNDQKGNDLTDASWKKTWTYHLVGGAVTPLGGGLVGDPLQRGVDAATTAWLNQESERINEKATADHQKTYDKRNGQLMGLADEWYQVNEEWAKDPDHEGYSKNQGVYDQIAAAANDGNKKAEGVAGIQ